ncbi:hypothetical protein V2J09_016684 [Rumex salicifolius]
MMINGAQLMPSGGGEMEVSALDRQRAALKWQQDHLYISQFPQQQQQQQTYFEDFSMSSLQTQQNFQGGLQVGEGDDSVLNTARSIKPDPGLESGSGSGWTEYGLTASTTTTTMDNSSGSGHGVLNNGISWTVSCPPGAAKESLRKRKADHKNTLLPPKTETETENESRAKKVKSSCKEDELVPKKVDQSFSNSKNGSKLSKSKSKGGSEAQKLDYIHVRARRGQATDSHSLAERVRREKISERMKYLQDLVPGCNKITGKAGMLDEIINYVQSLQRQVEFLSMKLAAVNPRFDFNIQDLFAKEACSSNFPGSEITSEMANLAYLQINQGHQLGPLSASDLGMSEVEMGLRRSISAPVSIPETFIDSSCLTVTYLPWDQSDGQTMYNMDFQQQQSFPSQKYTVSSPSEQQ